MDAQAVTEMVARTLGWAASQAQYPVIRRIDKTEKPTRILITLENGQVFRLAVKEATK